MPLKDISYLELWQPFIQWTGIICAILEEGTMSNNPVKLFGNWTNGSGGMPCKGISYLAFLQPLSSAERNHLCNLVEGIMRNISVKLF